MGADSHDAIFFFCLKHQISQTKSKVSTLTPIQHSGQKRKFVGWGYKNRGRAWALPLGSLGRELGLCSSESQLWRCFSSGKRVRRKERKSQCLYQGHSWENLSWAWLGAMGDCLTLFYHPHPKLSKTEWLCSSACPGTHSVDQAYLKLWDPPTSTSGVLGMKVWATTTCILIF